MPDENKVIHVLQAAKARISTPAQWCRGSQGLDAKGEYVAPWHEQAQRRCALGALNAGRRAYIYPLTNRDRVTRVLDAAARELGHTDIVSLNNSTDHATVMRMFDRAIQLAQQEAPAPTGRK